MTDLYTVSAMMTITSLRAEVREQLRLEQEAVRRHDLVAATLRRNEGKKITRRFNNALSAIGMEIAYRFGSIYAVPANKTMWNAEFSHQIGRETDDQTVYTEAQFEHMDACQGSAARQRIAEREAWLASDAPERVAAQTDALLAQIESFAQAPFGPGRYIAQGVVKKFLELKLLWRVS